MISVPVYANRVRNGPASAVKAVLQPAKAAAMCAAPCAQTHPPPPIPLLLLAQNLSSKQIAPIDNMRPKSDDAKWRHWG